MSLQHSIFIKWFIGATIGLTVTMGAGLASFYNMTIRFEERTEQRIIGIESINQIELKSVKAMHNKDIQYLVKDIKQIRLDQGEVLKILRRK